MTLSCGSWISFREHHYPIVSSSMTWKEREWNPNGRCRVYSSPQKGLRFFHTVAVLEIGQWQSVVIKHLSDIGFTGFSACCKHANRLWFSSNRRCDFMDIAISSFRPNVCCRRRPPPPPPEETNFTLFVSQCHLPSWYQMQWYPQNLAPVTDVKFSFAVKRHFFFFF